MENTTMAIFERELLGYVNSTKIERMAGKESNNMKHRNTVRDEIMIADVSNLNLKTTIQKTLNDVYLRVSGLGISGYLRNFISHKANEFTSVLVKEQPDKTVYLTVHYNDDNSISILTDYHKTPGIVNKWKEYKIDLDTLVSFVTENGIEIIDDRQWR